MKKYMLTLAASLITLTAQAEVRVGVVVAETGPAASLGIPARNVFELLPATLGGEPVKYIVLDDASDTTSAVRQARKLIEQEKVDLVIGSSTVPTSIAVAGVAGELKTPQLALAPMSIDTAQNAWAYAVPQPTRIMMSAVVDDMQAKGLKTVAYLGFSDSWGDMVLAGLEDNLSRSDIKLVASERYARADTSVAGQVLKLTAAKPDAVVVGGAGTPGVLPQMALRERGYKGPIYHNTGVINRDFLRVGGKVVEEAYAPTGPVMVAEQLLDENLIKPAALTFIEAYEGKYGKGMRNAFAAYAWDAYLLADKAVQTAAKTAKPGTAAFREAVRTALENNKEVVGTHAVYNMTEKDHTGVDARASALVQVKNGDWVLVTR